MRRKRNAQSLQRQLGAELSCLKGSNDPFGDRAINTNADFTISTTLALLRGCQQYAKRIEAKRS